MIDPVTSAACVVCGATHSQCGPAADVVPVDIPMMEVKPVRELRELRLYEVVVNGYATRMKLDSAEAERMGGKPVEEKIEAAASTEDAPEEASPDSPIDEAPVTTKARQRTANRARGAGDDK